MQIQGNDNVIDKLLCGDDDVVFNLVALIREQPGARLNTDGASYLTAQSNDGLPIWVYVNSHADESTEKQLFAVLSAALKKGASISVNAQSNAEAVLRTFAAMRNLKLTRREPLNVYYIKQVNSIAPVGEITVADERFVKDIAELIKQSAVDDCDGDMSDAQAADFANTHARSGNLYLWRQGGSTVSMARIVRYGRFARITSVVTERAARGNGYAKMLVGELCSRLLNNGLTPVLYARSENASSNRCYMNIGFKKAGEVCEYTLVASTRPSP